MVTQILPIQNIIFTDLYWIIHSSVYLHRVWNNEIPLMIGLLGTVMIQLGLYIK